MTAPTSPSLPEEYCLEGRLGEALFEEMCDGRVVDGALLPGWRIASDEEAETCGDGTDYMIVSPDGQVWAVEVEVQLVRCAVRIPVPGEPEKHEEIPGQLDLLSEAAS